MKRKMRNGVLEILDDKDQIIMTVEESVMNNIMNIAISGTIKNDVAHEFEDEIMASLSVCPIIQIDFTNTKYIASMAMRSLLSIQQMIDNIENSELILKLSPEVKQVFEESGFIEIFNIVEQGD